MLKQFDIDANSTSFRRTHFTNSLIFKSIKLKMNNESIIIIWMIVIYIQHDFFFFYQFILLPYLICYHSFDSLLFEINPFFEINQKIERIACVL